MTAITTSRPDAAGTSAGLGLLPGFGALLRKELTEWRRGRRAVVAGTVATLGMVLTALNGWIVMHVAPSDGSDPGVEVSYDPLTNLVGAVSSQVFVLVAIFAVMSLLVAERDSGTLAWTASKPVSRTAIWLAKFVGASAVLWLVAGLVPLVASLVVVVMVYGPVPPVPVIVMAAGIGMATVLYVAVGLAAGAFFNSQAAVAGVGIAVLALPQLVGLVLPPQLLPTSILQWSIMTAVGESVGVITVIVWALTVIGLVGVAVRRMERIEL